MLHCSKISQLRGEHGMLMVQTFARELICIWNYITITEHKCSICQLQGDEGGGEGEGEGSDSNSCSMCNMLHT